MKSNAIARIILYSLLIALLVGVLITVTCFDLFRFNIDSGSDFSGDIVSGEEVTLDPEDVDRLELDWAAGTIRIVAGDTDQITVTESGEITQKYRMACNLKGGTLSIAYAKGSVSFGFGSIPSKDLTVTVPQDWVCEELKLDAAAVEVYVDGLTVENLELDGAAAELEFNGAVKNVDVDGAAVKLELTCTNQPYQIDIDGASCEFTLYLPEDCGFQVEMDSLSCAFHSDLDYTTRAGQYLYGNEGCRIFVDGLSCSVSINHAPVVTEAE